MRCVIAVAAGVAVWAAACGSCPGQEAAAPKVVFEENFDSYTDGEQPASIVELQQKQSDSGETVGHRYAVSNGNRHMLLASKVRDLDLFFTAEPHPRALRSPTIEVEFRTDPLGRRGYRIVHWMGTYNRLDLVWWDDTVAPPVQVKLASPKVAPLPLPVSAPIRFRLTVRGNTIEFRRGGERLLAFVDPAGDSRGAAGNVVFSSRPATWVPEDVAPVCFDDIRLETPDGIEPGRVLFTGRYRIPPDLRAMSVPTHHELQIAEIPDTGLDAVRTDTAGGSVFRVTASVAFPVLDGIKSRPTAARSPYLRLEDERGGGLRQRIYDGILGNVTPGQPGGGAAQLLRLMTSSADPPRYGIALRTQQAADASGPQSSSRFVTALPEDFNVVAGWDFFLDNDHLEAAGPVEAIFRRDGELVYAGPPLRPGDRVVLLESPLPAGIVSRVSERNGSFADFVRRFRDNHYFLEGSPVRFAVSVAVGPNTRPPAALRWRLSDAYRRPVEGRAGGGPLVSVDSDPAKRLRGIGRDLVGAELALGKLGPGVYWLDLEADGVELKRAFSVVPGDRRPGNTAARASGLPWIGGQIYPAMATAKDAGHYVSQSDARSADWREMLAAFNMKITGAPPGAVIPAAETSFLPGLRIWISASFSDEAMASFLAGPEYRRRPEDGPLGDPKTPVVERQRIVRAGHFKEWIDHWCRVRAANEVAQRKAWEEHAAGGEHIAYGPPLINTFYYGNLYSARYYGWDAGLVAKGPRLIDVFRMETYPHDFGRQQASYTPSIALTKLGCPSAGCGWEIYGAGGYVIDNRTAEGRPPHGLGYPSRNFIAHQVAELTLGPWTFDGERLQPAGHTHILPQTGPWTQEMLFGMIDGLRAAADAKDLVPLRGPAFVQSWAAAEQDPAWGRGSPLNAAAETPAYAYLQSRLAGLANGFFLDVSRIEQLDSRRTDLLVLPPLRAASAAQLAAVRRLHGEGVALVCFDDCTGLEDLFGVRRLDRGVPFRAVQPARGSGLLAGIEPAALNERVFHDGVAWYELQGGAEILSATDAGSRRVAPLLCIHRPAKGKPGCLFFAAGATDVGRRRHGADDLNLEGEVLSRLVQQAIRRGLLAVADPVVAVSPPGTVLAFRQPDDAVRILVMESSWPFNAGRPQEVELVLAAPGAADATIECERDVHEDRRAAGRRRVRLVLQPDEVVSLTVRGLGDAAAGGAAARP